MATAIVTGASTGIGHELAKLCAAAGYDLVLIARNQEKLESVAAAIRTVTGRRVRIIAKDLARPSAPAEIVMQLDNQITDTEILINNAGAGLWGQFAQLDADAQMQTLQLNVNALTHLTRLILPAMIHRRSGRILNVASTAAFQAGPLMAVYYASKAYVLSFSEALHEELKPVGVSVTTLCPGPTATDFQERANMTKTKLSEMAGKVDPAGVARAGFEGMMKGRPLVIPGAANRLGAFLTRIAPRQVSARIARSLQEG